MTMMKIVCPKCNAEAKLSLADPNYVGPRRCWKCHEYFTITIENNRVTHCEPLSAEEYEKQQEAKKAAEKMGGGGGGIVMSRRDEPESRQAPPAQPQRKEEFFRPPAQNPSVPTESTTKPTTFPPDRVKTFIPMEPAGKEPEKPKKNTPPKNPPDRFNIFIPPAT